MCYTEFSEENIFHVLALQLTFMLNLREYPLGYHNSLGQMINIDLQMSGQWPELWQLDYLKKLHTANI